jgi:Family of unknown function (DUF6506)
MVKPHTVGHIRYVEGANPERHRFVLEVNGVRTIVVFVPNAEQASLIATQLVDTDGAVLLELDGGLGAIGYARVVNAIRGAVPVGAVMFGAESLAGAADFASRYHA